MKLITSISAMILTHQNNSLALAEDTTTLSTTKKNKNQELQVLISRKTFQTMSKMFLPNSENTAVNKESELASSSEISINSDPDISLKPSSELDLTWEELY